MLNQYRPGAIVSMPQQATGYGVTPNGLPGQCGPQGSTTVCGPVQAQCYATFTIRALQVAALSATVFTLTTTDFDSFTPHFAKWMGDVGVPPAFDITSVVVSGVDSLETPTPADFYVAQATDMIPVNWKGFNRNAPMVITVTELLNVATNDIILTLFGTAGR